MVYHPMLCVCSCDHVQMYTRCMILLLLCTEPKISVEIPKNQSFDEGFMIRWELLNMDHLPDNLQIRLTVSIGGEQWVVNDPTKLSEFVSLALDGDSALVSITVAVGNVWTETLTINVTKPTTDPSK